MKPKGTKMDAHRGKKKDTVSIPKPTYKNLQLGKDAEMQFDGGIEAIDQEHWKNTGELIKKYGRKADGTLMTTKADSLNYRAGYDYGVQNWRQGYGPQGEDHVYQKGRWEGQNVGKAINYRKPVKVSKTRIVMGATGNAIKNLFKNNK